MFQEPQWIPETLNTKYNIYYVFSYTHIPFSLTCFNSARNAAAASSQADAASPVIFIYFSSNLFSNLCNDPLLGINGYFRESFAGVILSGATCCRQLEHIFRSCLPPTNVKPIPS